MQVVAAFNPDVIIIDSLRLFGLTDLNDPRQVVALLIKLSELRKVRPGLCIILCHHLRKLDQKGRQVKLSHSPEEWIENISGSQALIAHVDSIWGLDVERDDDSDMIVFALVRRNGNQKTLFLAPRVDDFGNPIVGFDLLSSTDPEIAVSKIFSKKELEAWEQLPKTFRWKDLLRTCGGETKKKMASKMLSKMRANSLISELDKEYTKIVLTVTVGGEF